MIQAKNSQNIYSSVTQNCSYGPHAGSRKSSFSHKKVGSVDAFRPLAVSAVKMLKFGAGGNESSRQQIRRSIVGQPVPTMNGQKNSKNTGPLKYED